MRHNVFLPRSLRAAGLVRSFSQIFKFKPEPEPFGRVGSLMAKYGSEQRESSYEPIREVHEICRRMRAHGQVHAQPGKQDRVDPDGGEMAPLCPTVRSRGLDCAFQQPLGEATSDTNPQLGSLARTLRAARR